MWLPSRLRDVPRRESSQNIYDLARFVKICLVGRYNLAFVRLGVIAAANITYDAVIAPAALVDGVEIAAVAARDGARAAAVAREWDVPVAYAGYDALLADDSIDSVYIATPVTQHRAWVLAALEAGKHVMCEKPFAVNATEATEMVAAGVAAERIVMEAFHWRYHPYVHQIRDVLDSGVIGEIVSVSSVANLPASFFGPDDIRWNFALGGGCMMDVGCYPLQWVRWLVGSEPAVVSVRADCPVPEVDGAATVELVWPSGVTGTVACSMMLPSEVRELELTAVGTLGTLTAYNPVLPQIGSTLVVDTGDGRREYAVERSTTYSHQLRAFRDAVATGIAPPTSGDEIIANMRLLDACYRAAGLQPRPAATDS
jgi:predicted dehydrogenase